MLRKRKSRGKKACWIRQRRRTNQNIRVKDNLNRLLRKFVHGQHSPTIVNLLGCNRDNFLLHIQSQFKNGMTWNNYGTFWHIDHRIPCAKFDLTLQEQQKLCYHFSNLQPLSKDENLKKGNKFDGNIQTTIPQDFP